MRVFLVKKYSLVLLVSILLLGFVLRFHNHTRWPRAGATFDEYAWTWLGMSIIDTGIPTSWSPHKAYKTRTHFKNSKGATFFLVTPYLEHPPLFGIVAGSYAKMVGMKDFNDVDPYKIRTLGIFLGVLSILAIYLLTAEIAGNNTGLLAALLYSIMPSSTVGSRLVQNENFFIPLFIFSLYFTVKYLRLRTTVNLLLSVVISSILPLAKIPWIAAPATVFALYLSKKRFKESVLVSIATLGFFSVFLLYGNRLDSELFISLWKLQLARYDMTYDTLFSLFRDPIITDRLFLDGFIYLGFFAFAVVAAMRKNEYLSVTLGFLSYFFLYLFAIPNEPGHGWYRFPIYPFLVVYIALMMKEYFNKNMILTWLIIIIPGMAALTMSWQQQFGFSYGFYRGFLLCSIIPFITLIFPQKWILLTSKIINIVLLCFVLALVVWSGLSYSEQ